jgi:predicted ATPase
MIRKLHLKFGASPDRPAVSLDVAAVTVFVGPNNSGKSIVLREIDEFCKNGKPRENHVILDVLEFRHFSADEIPLVIERNKVKPRPTDHIRSGHIFVGKHGNRTEVAESEFVQALEQPNVNSRSFCRTFAQYHTLMIGGKDRIKLVDSVPATDLQQPAQNVLDILFRDEAKRAKLRRITNEAFNCYFVIDPTHPGHFRVRFSSRKPETVLEECGLHPQAVEFHANATSVEQVSDGIKAFTGILAQFIAGEPGIVIIDEPEAFLHPALSFKLGKEISTSTSEQCLFVSTHSASFVMGCIQSGVSTNIIRLTYQRGVATARVLPQDRLLRLMRNPLLRSTRVLEKFVL